MDTPSVVSPAEEFVDAFIDAVLSLTQAESPWVFSEEKRARLIAATKAIVRDEE